MTERDDAPDALAERLSITYTDPVTTLFWAPIEYAARRFGLTTDMVWQLAMDGDLKVATMPFVQEGQEFVSMKRLSAALGNATPEGGW